MTSKSLEKTDLVDWKDLAAVTFSDASFANEAEFKSPQGHIHYIHRATE